METVGGEVRVGEGIPRHELGTGRRTLGLGRLKPNGTVCLKAVP